MNNRPYLSLITVARNDNYGGDFLHRFQVSLNTVLALCEEYRLDMELIIVDWNHPPGALTFVEVLAWPKKLKSVEIRIIEVPNKLHRKFPNSDKLTVFEFIGKNVGIRRARGEYILTTNIDDIFSRELVQFLAERKLSQECFYRTDTYRVKKTIPLDIAVDEQLELCGEHWYQVDMTKGPRRRRYPLLSYEYLRSSAAWLGGKLIHHPRHGIHTLASGDFFLMHHKHWYNLHGHPELPTYSHIDSYMCYMAASYGLSQIILSGGKRIYHQEHTRLKPGSLPTTDFGLCLKHGKQMLKSGRPMVFNDEKWGLAEENLTEINPL